MDKTQSLKERPLSDDYPLYLGYLYILNGQVWRNDDKEMTVRELKAQQEVKEITNCDIAGRDLWHLLY